MIVHYVILRLYHSTTHLASAVISQVRHWNLRSNNDHRIFPLLEPLSLSCARGSIDGKIHQMTVFVTETVYSRWYADKQQLRRKSFQTELICFPFTVILLSDIFVLRNKRFLFGNHDQRRSLIEEESKQQNMFILTRTLRENNSQYSDPVVLVFYLSFTSSFMSLATLHWQPHRIVEGAWYFAYLTLLVLP